MKLATAGWRMPSKGGRPTKAEGESGTKHVRVFEDLAEMISWISRIEGVNSARLLDPIIRGSVLARYETIAKDVEAIKKAEAGAAARHRKSSE